MIDYIRTIVRFVLHGTPRCVQCRNFHHHRSTNKIKCCYPLFCGKIGRGYKPWPRAGKE